MHSTTEETSRKHIIFKWMYIPCHVLDTNNYYDDEADIVDNYEDNKDHKTMTVVMVTATITITITMTFIITMSSEIMKYTQCNADCHNKDMSYHIHHC